MGGSCCKMVCAQCGETPRPPVSEFQLPRTRLRTVEEIAALDEEKTFVQATDERIEFVGRSRTNDGTDLEFNFCNSTIRFVVTGSEAATSETFDVSVTLMSPGNKYHKHTKMRGMLAQVEGALYYDPVTKAYIPGTTKSQKTAACLFSVYVDGVFSSRFAVPDGGASGEAVEVVVAENLSGKKDTTIELVHTSDPSFGMVIFKGLHLNESGILKKRSNSIAIKKKVIEFVGDSDATALGSLASFPALNMGYCMKHFLDYSDSDYSFCKFVSQAFGADHHNISAGGIGVVYPGDKYTATNVAGPAQHLYELMVGCNWNGRPNMAENKYNPGQNPMPSVDLVILWIGQNDIVAGMGPGKNVKGIEAYTSLLRTIRKHRPNVPVVCFYPEGLFHTNHPMNPLFGSNKKKCSAFNEDLKTWVESAVNTVGGDNLHARGVSFQPAFDPERDYGMFAEIGVGGAKKLARGMLPVIQEVTGWDIVHEDAGSADPGTTSSDYVADPQM